MKLLALAFVVLFAAVCHGDESQVEASCKNWCAGHSKAVATKCKWGACSGCAFCVTKAPTKAPTTKAPTTKAPTTKAPTKAPTMPWEGAYGPTKAVQNPVDEPGVKSKTVGKGKHKVAENCKTAVALKGDSSEYHEMEKYQCTSCPASMGFAMTYHKRKVGQCLKYPDEPYNRCIYLDKDSPTFNVEATNFMCTKIVNQQQLVRVTEMSAGAQTHFKKVISQRRRSSSQNGRVVAHCHVRKETVCRTAGCRVVKEVKCHKVCRYKSSVDPGKPWKGWKQDGCETSVCSGAYGASICKLAAAVA